ncbi:MAG: 6-hydroxycyclohex-1-ene-1-carbonyl-CoA dehydrogenase [Pseudomonadota bacterium]
MAVPDKIATWQMVQPATRNKETGETIPGKLELFEIPFPDLTPGEVLVEIAGCGVCQTDLGFFYDGIPTVSKPPLTLGHEISGTVVAGGTSWLGKEVLIPAVMPCGQCSLCRTGRGNLCLTPKIPGNSTGIYGGFSSHIPVPGNTLCEIKNRKTIPLEHLAAVADTVATAFHAAKRASIEVGDNVIVIGAGAMGPFIVQMVKALGAGTVMVVDLVETRLQKILTCGASFVTNSTGKSPQEMAAEVKYLQKTQGLPAFGWKIFEATGTKSGQETAFALLGKAGKLILLASEMATVEYATSHFIAMDAEIIGIRGCMPEDYPQVLDMVTSGKIILSPFVQTRPMSWIREVFAEARIAPPDKHILLTTDDLGLDNSQEPKSCR